jgi:hypothetical protein
MAINYSYSSSDVRQHHVWHKKGKWEPNCEVKVESVKSCGGK